MFKKLFSSVGRATKAYEAAVDHLWYQWKEQSTAMRNGIVDGNNLEMGLNALLYRRLMSEFWVAIIAEEAPWERIDINGTFQAERQNRQQFANQLVGVLPEAAQSADLAGFPPPLAPVVVALRTLSEAELLEFVGYEYVVATCTNIALQQVPNWRQQSNDRKAWTNEDLMEFYGVHDSKVARHLARLKTTVGWDEIPVQFKVV